MSRFIPEFLCCFFHSSRFDACESHGVCNETIVLKKWIVQSNAYCYKFVSCYSYGGSAISKQESAIRFGIAKDKAIVMQKIDCKGNETNILDCSHEIGLKGSNYNYKNDHHEDDLAVVCYKGTSKM